MSSLEEAMDGVMSKLDFLDMHIEHEFVTIEDQLANLKSKIESVGPSDSTVADVVRKVQFHRFFTILKTLTLTVAGVLGRRHHVTRNSRQGPEA